MTDPEAIARGLTKAQREALTSGNQICAQGPWRTTNALFDRGLTDADERFTPLGLSVRDVLMRDA